MFFQDHTNIRATRVMQLMHNGSKPILKEHLILVCTHLHFHKYSFHKYPVLHIRMEELLHQKSLCIEKINTISENHLTHNELLCC